MSSRNNPQVQARIFQARHKKQQELQGTAHAYFVRGARGAAKIAGKISRQLSPQVYNVESQILWEMRLLPADKRVLFGSDCEKTFENLVAEARAALLSTESSEAAIIRISVQLARSDYEARSLHREFTDIRKDDLAENRRKMFLDDCGTFPRIKHSEVFVEDTRPVCQRFLRLPQCIPKTKR